MEAEFEESVEAVEESTHPDQLELEPLVIRPRKSDITIEPVALVWTPWTVDRNGIAEPAFRSAE